MDEVIMGTMGVHGFDNAEDVWQFKLATCDSPGVELATYKLSLRGES